jgi:hypothetical protein
MIFAPSNAAFQDLFHRGKDVKEEYDYQLESFLFVAITSNIMKAHVKPSQDPSYSGVQTANGTLVKVDRVHFHGDDVHDERNFLRDWVKSLKFEIYGVDAFDQCCMISRQFLGMTTNDAIFRRGTESRNFHEATGKLLDRILLYVENKISQPSFTTNIYDAIYKKYMESKPKNSREMGMYQGTYSDTLLRNLVPRDPGNAENVFAHFMSQTTSHMEGIFYGSTKLRDAISIAETVVAEISFADIQTKFDTYLMVYGMIIDFTNVLPESWYQLIHEGKMENYDKAIMYMNGVFRDFTELNKAIF